MYVTVVQYLRVVQSDGCSLLNIRHSYKMISWDEDFKIHS